jgi:hypothetical protein
MSMLGGDHDAPTLVPRARTLCASCHTFVAIRADTRCAWCFGPKMRTQGQGEISEEEKVKATIWTLEALHTFDVMEQAEVAAYVERTMKADELSPFNLLSQLERLSTHFASRTPATNLSLSSAHALMLLELIDKLLDDKEKASPRKPKAEDAAKAACTRRAFYHAIGGFTFDPWNINASEYEIIKTTYGRNGVPPQTMAEVWEFFDENWASVALQNIHAEQRASGSK